MVPVLGRGGQSRGRIGTVVVRSAGATRGRTGSRRPLVAPPPRAAGGGAAAAAVRVTDPGGVHRLAGVLAGELAGRRHRGTRRPAMTPAAPAPAAGCTTATSAGPSCAAAGAAPAPPVPAAAGTSPPPAASNRAACAASPPSPPPDPSLPEPAAGAAARAAAAEPGDVQEPAGGHAGVRARVDERQQPVEGERGRTGQPAGHRRRRAARLRPVGVGQHVDPDDQDQGQRRLHHRCGRSPTADRARTTTAVASASSPAAVIGEVATRTANTASRKMFSSRKPESRRDHREHRHDAEDDRPRGRVELAGERAGRLRAGLRRHGVQGVWSGRRGWGRG